MKTIRLNRVADIITENGIPFAVRVVFPGEGYGCYWGNGVHALTLEAGAEPLVEFYDARYSHTPFGQFVSRYNYSTMIERVAKNTGLNLCGGEPDWVIDSVTMLQAISYAKYFVDKKNSSM